MTLSNDTIQVGFASLDRPRETPGSAASILADDENARAARFYFERDRTRFTRARTLLRIILGAELGLPPGSVRFAYGAHGKPELAPDLARSGVRFNVSHSHGLGLFVVARGAAIGADVELVRPVSYGRAVARRYFAEDECEALEGLTGEAWDRAFFRCWTRKEAFVKALGEGLSFPLRDFSVSVAEGAPARILRAGGKAGAPDRFSMTALPAGRGHEAALVVEGKPRAIAPLSVELSAIGVSP